MTRFVVQLLIVSLLTLNIAWAGDECAFLAPGTAGSTSAQTNGQTPADPTNTGFDCDNWCQAWVSTVALPGSSVPGICITAAVQSGFYSYSYSSLPIPPPFHPPGI